MLKSSYMLALITLVCFGLGPIFEKVGLRDLPPFYSAAMRTWVIAILFGIIVLFFHDGFDIKQFAGKGLIFLSLGAIITGLLGVSFFYMALKTGDVSKVVFIVSASPVLTFVIASIFLKEPVTIMKILGSLLIFTGIFLLH